MKSIMREEYPRPQFARGSFLNLNGDWEFSFDTDTFDRSITVPFVYQSKLSGIGDRSSHDTVWYRRRFSLPADMQGKKIIINFGAVDYSCEVRLNGQLIGTHTGGHISFKFDITGAVRQTDNELVLKVNDVCADMEMPRGKQIWKEKSEGIFYTPSTGIWQTVWIEAVSSTALESVFITPDLDTHSVHFTYKVTGSGHAELTTDISFEGKHIVKTVVAPEHETGSFSVHLEQQILLDWNFGEDLVWTPERPRLFDVVFTVSVNGKETDRVTSYFGMRKVSVENGQFMLNNRPYYQKLLLDQGYWPESLLTAPEDAAFVRDITLAKSMGFNGVRKHQKIEDPRFLYHADKIGFLVWGEFPAAYVYSRTYLLRITDEWIAELSRDYNHPSIVAWTPLNESWGVPQIKDRKDEQAHSAAMVYLTKSFDQTRPVISNDGWEQTCPDMLTIHDYESSRKILLERYRSMESILSFIPGGRMLFAHGWSYKGQPVLVTEFGGISYKKGEQEGWGYSAAKDDGDFARRLYDVVSPLRESPFVRGYCYTQLTDVEQEINGLCTAGREPKINPEIIKAINDGTWTPESK